MYKLRTPDLAMLLRRIVKADMDFASGTGLRVCSRLDNPFQNGGCGTNTATDTLVRSRGCVQHAATERKDG